LNPQLHAPYISSPSHRHLFATHDRTSAAYSAAIPMLCHLHLRQSYAHIIDVARICMRSSVYETVECPYVCDPSIDNSNSRQRVCWCPVSKRYRSIAAGAQQHMLSRWQPTEDSQHRLVLQWCYVYSGPWKFLSGSTCAHRPYKQCIDATLLQM